VATRKGQPDRPPQPDLELRDEDCTSPRGLVEPACVGGVTIENNSSASTMEGRGSWHYIRTVSRHPGYDGASIRDFKVRYNTFETSVAL